MTTIPEFPCNDCGVNTVPLEGPREYYELLDTVWHREVNAPGIGQSDNGLDGFWLCIACVEKRMGRKLWPQDFKRPVDFPANKPSEWLSAKLNNRLGAVRPLPRWQWYQFFPNPLIEAVLDRYEPVYHSVTPTGSLALGGNCEWPEDPSR